MRGTALCGAIETRNYEITKFLLDSGCDVNAQDYDGEPPLLLAIRKESPGKICGKQANLDIIKLIMDQPKCDLNKVDPLTKKSALHFATEQNMLQVVRWLLNCKSDIKCKINMIDANGNSPLHLAVLEGHSGVVEVLVNDAECLLKVYNKAGLTPLHVCARNGDLKNMQCLLNKVIGSKRDQLVKSIECDKLTDSELDANLNAVTMYEKETCLHIASRQGHAELVELLLEYGAKVDMKNNVNNTPLLVAIASTPQWQTKNNRIPKLLLKKGANPNMIFSQHLCRYVRLDLYVSPLILAARNNNIGLAKLLVAHGADVNLTDRLGQTALFIALSEQSFDVASYLVSESSDINVNLRTECGDTCLHALVHRSKKQDPNSVVEMLKVMIRDKGAVVVPNLNSETAIDVAFQYEDYVLADAILEVADVDLKDIMQTEERLQNLMCAVVESGHIELVKVLLSHGTDIDMKYRTFYQQGDDMSTYLYLALESTEYKMAEFLVVNGADLRKETYIFADVDSDSQVNVDQGNEKADAENTDDDNDSNDDSDDDDIFLASDDDTDVFHGNIAFRSWIRQIASNPQSLQLKSLIFIRKYFLNHHIPFKRMTELKLPTKLIKKLRYQT